ncbi:hypothetical protein AHMF7605_10470 [Adhaeribacter arboris]|uniref:Uncharacterized protein n=1 Tax=Adhaeribacter arboris TaxID=2072846 RepID=A0A2T2YEG8_9BACT|nr:hypothetical protein [Adhaeribacter arboris]PSR53911.1 hypothetical protein AHMF7605_10470 [Adhaeribacter arboris]
MQMDIIRLSEVLKIMAVKAQPFDIVYCTADVKKGTGGEIKVRNGCRLSGIKKVNTEPAEPTETVPVPAGKTSKNPHHFENATRNIIKANGAVRTVHIFLILQFNGKKVII